MNTVYASDCNVHRACVCQPHNDCRVGETASLSTVDDLSEPLCNAKEPQDLLAMMMATMERMSQASINETEMRICVNQKKLDKAMDTYLEKLSETIEQLKKEKSKGFLRNAFDSIVNVCAKIIAATVDFAKDSIEAPIEIAIAVAKGNDDPLGALKGALKEQYHELTTNGCAAESVEQFTKGVLAFSADLAEFVQDISVELARTTASGRSFDVEKLKEKCSELWESLSSNILRNEGFWDVMEVVAIAAVIAGSIMTGGALGVVAIALVVLLQVDKKTGVIEDIAGKEAAPWIRLGMSIAAAACSAGASGEYVHILQTIQATTTTISGVAAIDQARVSYLEAKRQKQEMMREADLRQSLHNIQQLRDMIDELIQLLDERSTDRAETHSAFHNLVQTQANSFCAAVIKA